MSESGKDASASIMTGRAGATERPLRIWVRICGGGTTFPSGKTYVTVVGDDRAQPNHTEYVRVDVAEQMAVALEKAQDFLGGCQRNAELRETSAAIASLRSPTALPPPAGKEVTGWQPIESAPKDGAKVDLWHPTKGRCTDSFWQKQTYTLYEQWGWSNQWWGRIVGPTHWQPLPPAPTITHKNEARS